MEEKYHKLVERVLNVQEPPVDPDELAAAVILLAQKEIWLPLKVLLSSFNRIGRNNANIWMSIKTQTDSKTASSILNNTIKNLPANPNNHQIYINPIVSLIKSELPEAINLAGDLYSNLDNYSQKKAYRKTLPIIHSLITSKSAGFSKQDKLQQVQLFQAKTRLDWSHWPTYFVDGYFHAHFPDFILATHSVIKVIQTPLKEPVPFWTLLLHDHCDLFTKLSCLEHNKISVSTSPGFLHTIEDLCGMKIESNPLRRNKTLFHLEEFKHIEKLSFSEFKRNLWHSLSFQCHNLAEINFRTTCNPLSKISQILSILCADIEQKTLPNVLKGSYSKALDIALVGWRKSLQHGKVSTEIKNKWLHLFKELAPMAAQEGWLWEKSPGLQHPEFWFAENTQGTTDHIELLTLLKSTLVFPDSSKIFNLQHPHSPKSSLEKCLTQIKGTGIKAKWLHFHMANNPVQNATPSKPKTSQRI